MKKKVMKNSLIVLIIVCTLVSCNNKKSTPKPYAYMRIDLPTRKYQDLKTGYPFSFSYSKHAYIEQDKAYDAEKYWINVVYPSINAKIHLSYKDVTNNFAAYSDDSHKLAYKHYIKAEAINEKGYTNKKDNVYGIVYNIKGNTASSIQFFVTDSTKHFLRGSLYFNCKPNKDSLAPFIQYMHTDIKHMIESFKWSKNNSKK